MTHPPIDSQITFLYTHDLEETDRFYQETMGFPLKLDQGRCLIYQISSSSYLGFCLSDDGPTGPSDPGARQVILTIVTSEVDLWYRHLGEQGLSFEKPPSVNPTYNIYHCFLRDPSGYLIEIQRFLHDF